jgi:hypothetical protein
MGDGACLWSDELKISQPVQHTAIRPKKKKKSLVGSINDYSFLTVNNMNAANIKEFKSFKIELFELFLKIMKKLMKQ